jgi:hypothetical protein
MGLDKLIKEGDTIFKRIDELDTRLYDIENEYDTDHLEDKSDLEDYLETVHFRKISQLANQYIQFLGKVREMTEDKLSTSSKYIMKEDLQEGEEEEFKWDGDMNPVNQDTSIHIKVENSLGLMKDILFILKRLKKQKRKKLTKRKQGLTIIKSKGPTGPKGHIEDLDSAVVEQIYSQLKEIPMEDEVLDRIDEGKLKVKKKKKLKKKIKNVEKTQGEGVDFKTFKVGSDYPSTCRPRIDKPKSQCKSHNLKKKKCKKSKKCKKPCYESRVHVLNL